MPIVISSSNSNAGAARRLPVRRIHACHTLPRTVGRPGVRARSVRRRNIKTGLRDGKCPSTRPVGWAGSGCGHRRSTRSDRTLETHSTVVDGLKFPRFTAGGCADRSREGETRHRASSRRPRGRGIPGPGRPRLGVHPGRRRGRGDPPRESGGVPPVEPATANVVQRGLGRPGDDRPGNLRPQSLLRGPHRIPWPDPPRRRTGDRARCRSREGARRVQVPFPPTPSRRSLEPPLADRVGSSSTFSTISPPPSGSFAGPRGPDSRPWS